VEQQATHHRLPIPSLRSSPLCQKRYYGWHAKFLRLFPILNRTAVTVADVDHRRPE
jgi:hypothetical protein